MNFMEISNHLFVNLDNVTCVSIDCSNPRVVKVQFVNNTYQALAYASAEEADAALKEIAARLPTWKSLKELKDNR